MREKYYPDYFCLELYSMAALAFPINEKKIHVLANIISNDSQNPAHTCIFMLEKIHVPFLSKDSNIWTS